MSRRHSAEKRQVLPDAKYHDPVLSKFMNVLMYDGKKSAAEEIVYGALELIEKKAKADPVKLFRDALDKGAAKYEFHAYPGARHSFTVVEADAVSKKFNLPGLQYNKAADEQSWSDMQKLFKDKLGK